MRVVNYFSACLLDASALSAALCVSSVVAQTTPADAVVTPSDMAQYRRALDDYNRAWQSHAAAAGAYWSSISEKRQLRNAKRARGEPLSISDYVLTQPPIYRGPPKPPNPLKPEAPAPRASVPVVADFLTAARQEFKFTPRLPQSESEFERASGARRRSDQRSDCPNLWIRGNRRRKLRCRSWA
jgi:hypothetical protein